MKDVCVNTDVWSSNMFNIVIMVSDLKKYDFVGKYFLNSESTGVFILVEIVHMLRFKPGTIETKQLWTTRYSYDFYSNQKTLALDWNIFKNYSLIQGIFNFSPE